MLRRRALLRLLHTLAVGGQLLVRRARGQAVFSPESLHETFQRLGATYVKIGQFIASTPSVFPARYVKAFQNCLDQARPIPYARIQRLLEQEMPAPLEQLFRHIEPVPLACASIAQVHAATLASGEHVVLKVLRPGVVALLRTDLWFLRQLARVGQRFAPALRRTAVADILADLQQVVIDECDLSIEARRLQTFAGFLATTRARAVTVPRVHAELSTPRVLVMERLFGEFMGKQRQGPLSLPAAQALHAAMWVWLSSIAHCQFFHADVHAGNLLWLPDGRIGLIDFGIVGTIDPASWTAVAALFEGLRRQNYRKAAGALVELGAAGQDVDVDGLAAGLARLCTQAAAAAPSSAAAGQAERTQNFVADLAGLSQSHGLRFPRELFLLLKQYLYFDFSNALATEGGPGA